MVLVPGLMVPGLWDHLANGPWFGDPHSESQTWLTPHFDHKTHFSNYVSYILGDLIPRRAHKSRKFAKMSKKSILSLFGNP